MLQCNRSVTVRQTSRQPVVPAVSLRPSLRRYRLRGLKRRVQPSRRALSPVKLRCTATNRGNTADNASSGVQPRTSHAVVQLLCVVLMCQTDQTAAANTVFILFPWLSYIVHCHLRLACPAVRLLASMKLSIIAPICLPQSWLVAVGEAEALTAQQAAADLASTAADDLIIQAAAKAPYSPRSALTDLNAADKLRPGDYATLQMRGLIRADLNDKECALGPSRHLV